MSRNTPRLTVEPDDCSSSTSPTVAVFSMEFVEKEETEKSSITRISVALGRMEGGRFSFREAIDENVKNR